MASDLKGVPGGAELWRADGKVYLVYYTPAVDGQTPVPLLYHIPRIEDLQGILGPTGTLQLDRDLKAADLTKTGGQVVGLSTQLVNTSQHPFELFTETFTREAQIRPWLRDPEVFRLHTQAILEGRTVTEAELRTTNWWRTHTPEQRAWLTFAAGEGSQTVNERLEAGRRNVRDALAQAGVSNATDDLVKLVADNVTTGVWTPSYGAEQIRKLADPSAAGTLDGKVVETLAGFTLDTTRQREDKVSQLVREWLGPLNGWTPEMMQQWAGRLRNDPDAEQELVDTLKLQKKGVYANHDVNLTYEEMAAPWRGLASRFVGGPFDERDGWFQKIVQTADVEFAEDKLTALGLERGWGPVLQQASLTRVPGLGEPGIVRAA